VIALEISAGKEIRGKGFKIVPLPPEPIRKIDQKEKVDNRGKVKSPIRICPDCGGHLRIGSRPSKTKYECHNPSCAVVYCVWGDQGEILVTRKSV
jgi:hypothetical protein